MAPRTCNTAGAAPACVAAGQPTDAKVTVAITPSDATSTAVVAAFPETATKPLFDVWLRKSIPFTPTATSVTLTLTQPNAASSQDFGLDNLVVEALPCATGVNLELLVNSQTGTSTTDPALSLTSQDAVRVEVSKGLTHTVNDGATFIDADGGAPIGACTGAGTPTAPDLTLPRGALLYTFDDVKYFKLPQPAVTERPFTIRGPSSTPTSLKFIINDCSDERTANPGKNNFGSVTVLIRSLPTVSCENVLGGCTVQQAVFDGKAPLLIALMSGGESMVVTTTGVWGVSSASPPVLGTFDADGFQGVLPVGTCTPPLPSAKFGALIGSFDGFGVGSHPFLIGKGPTTVKNFGCQGTLQVASNDCFTGDNYGGLTLSFCSHQQALTTFNTDPGVCTRSLTFNTPVVTDKCPGSTFLNAPPSPFGVGGTFEVFQATDDQNEFAQCYVGFTVVDNEAPKFTLCPSNIVVNAAVGVCNAVVGVAQGYNTPTATDNCGATVVVNLTPTFGVGASFPVGTTPVTWEATAGGLKTQCTFTVKVVDNQKPTITCAAPAQSFCTGSVQALSGFSTINDNCAATPTVVSPVGFNGLVPSGTVSVTLGAKDVAGNVADVPCTFSLTGIAENGGCGGTDKCIATQCVSGCIAGVDLTGCTTPGDNFAYQYGVGKKACTKIIRDPADFRNVIIGNVGGWTTTVADGNEAILDTFVGKFKMTSTGFPATVRTFTQVSGGTKSIELKTPVAVTPTSVCSMKFNGSDRKRAVGSLVLGGGASFPII